MTLEQLRRAVGRKIGMDYSTAGDDRNLIDAWCNEGVREVLLRTHCYVAVADVQTVANEWQYDLSTNIMAITQLWRDGETSPTIRVTPEEIIALRRQSGSTDATSLRWALEGTNLLLLWPTPTSVYDIDFIYVPRPTEMASNEHDPSNSVYGGIPVEYHKAIELWALWNGSDHEHDGTTQRGVNYLAQFDEYLKKVKGSVNRKGGALPRARVGRRHWPANTSNSRYPA